MYNKTLKDERITLPENEKDERELVKIFNEYFSNIKLKYSTPTKYYASPPPGIEHKKQNLKTSQVY